MSEPFNQRALLAQEQRASTDKDLARSYFELLDLRQRFRIAQCGRAAIDNAPPAVLQLMPFPQRAAPRR